MVSPVTCQICKKPVILETARIDECGKPVHEECYLQSIQAARQPYPEDPEPRG